MTPALSERCSNQLSYGPLYTKTSEKKDKRGKPDSIQISSNAYTAFTFILPSVLPKEVIQPHFPVRLPCYDFTPLTSHTLENGPLAVSLSASGIPSSDSVTGGVYKARERIHRAVLMRDY